MKLQNSKLENYKVAIIDYGLGNLFSIQQALVYVGLPSIIASSWNEISKADAIILPGVGAFGDSIKALKKLDLIEPLKEVVEVGKPLMGICLGLQLLMKESCEFGVHEGLGIVDGSVVPFENPMDGSEKLKVPQIGWNRIYPESRETTTSYEKNMHAFDRWQESPFTEIKYGEYMYFNHSFYAQLSDNQDVLSYSKYGNIWFCSSLLKRNIFACQFHPERSGPQGLQIYKHFITFIEKYKKD